MLIFSLHYVDWFMCMNKFGLCQKIYSENMKIDDENHMIKQAIALMG